MARDLLYAQSHRRGWTYQGLWLPSRGALGGKSKNETVPGRDGASRKDTSLLKAGPETFMIQITNVNPELLADDIKVYVQSKNKDIKVLNVEDLRRRGRMEHQEVCVNC